MQKVQDAEEDLTVLPSSIFFFSFEGDKDTASRCTLKLQSFICYSTHSHLSSLQEPGNKNDMMDEQRGSRGKAAGQS